MIDLYGVDVPEWDIDPFYFGGSYFAPSSGGAQTGGGPIVFGGGNVGPIQLPRVTLPPIRIPDIRIGGGGSARDRAVQIVNAYEQAFRQNRDAVRAGQISPEEGQQTFEALWAQMAGLLAPLGEEGRRAIEDRQPGGKFDWWAAYDRFLAGGPATGTGPLPGPLPAPGGTGTAGGISLGGLALVGLLGYFAFRH
jgi:hypothetical protein